jgi:Zinc finger, C3HC4 type (RING finger)
VESNGFYIGQSQRSSHNFWYVEFVLIPTCSTERIFLASSLVDFILSGPPKSGIQILPAKDLLPEMQARLKDVTEMLDIPSAAAAVLLREYKWSKERLMEVFCSDSENVLKKCGIYHRCNPKPPLKNPGNNCPICYDPMEDGQKLAMPCGHEFCMDCWHDFCANAIQEEGPCSCNVSTSRLRRNFDGSGSTSCRTRSFGQISKFPTP